MGLAMQGAYLAMCAISILTSAALAADVPSPGMLWPSQMAYPIVRAAKAPDLEKPDPLADPAWQQAEPLGPLFCTGRPEEPSRATTVRILCADSRLYFAVRCLDPQPDGIKAVAGTEDMLKDDTIEMVLSQESDRLFPCICLQVNPAGRLNAYRCLQRFAQNRSPLKEVLGAEAVRVRTGKDTKGWWVCGCLSMQAACISQSAFLANIMRIRQADGSDPAWLDLWTRRLLIDLRLQPMTIVDRLPPPAPRLRMPAGLAVGTNRLQVADWSAGCSLLLDGRPVPVAGDGTCQVRIARHGPVSVQLVGPEGKPAITYSSEVPRPLIVQAVEPFQPDMTKPIGIDVALNATAPGPIEISLEVRQDGKVVGSHTVSLANGTHRVQLACKPGKPGEIQIVARAKIPAESGEPVEIGAAHWCALGLNRDQFDRFRPDIDSLSTLSLYRTGLADACNFYHLIQAGNGQYRHYGRREGRLGVSEWSDGMTYAFALLYTADWPENPHRDDPRMLASASAGMEFALAPETWYKQIEHPANRHIQAWLLTYDLLKDKIPAEQAAYWRDRLIQITQVTVDRWILPATGKFSFYGEDVGTGTNHWAYHAANVYTAGKVFDRPEWRELGRTMMRRLAGHERDGFFPERRGIPAMHYTWLTANALGQYYWQSGDEHVLPSLERCAECACRTALPGGAEMVIVQDGRNNQPSLYYFGDFVLSLTPEGRGLAHVRIANRISSQRKPSQNQPEFWFRTAENAFYFRPGQEQPAPESFEFPFLDGRGLIAGRGGFIYGLSAICITATDTNYQTDPQNAFELNHAKVGRILSGANSEQQPEAGSFCRKHKDRTEFMPVRGNVERTDNGHVTVLEFDTFKAWVRCEILSPTAARITVQLLDVQGDEPVVFNFFPVARGAAELRGDGETTVLNLQDVAIRCSQPVRLQSDFRIVDPYSLTYRVAGKPVRAYAELKADRPLVLDVSIRESVSASQPVQGRGDH